MNHTELWEKAKGFLQEDLASVSFETWINTPLTPVNYEDGELVLEGIDQLHIRTVETRYLSVIETAVSQAAGSKVRIRILSREEARQWMEEHRSGEKAAPAPALFNSRYTFDSFVVGSSNRFAHAAALAVAEHPGEAYNPLFLYGAAGLGKTHLMHAIGHFIQEHYPAKRLLYLPSETFMNEMISAIQKNATQAFRDRFRNLDVLMVDDIQFIAGRDSTQEEFFHTFNALHNSGKQIIISSDRPPRDINKLEERLRSRFEWGMIADIQKPDFDTKVAILRKKADEEHIEVSNDALELIAGHTKDSIRELEGALTRVYALARLNAKPIDSQVISEALRDIGEIRDTRSITPDLIIGQVAGYCKLTPEQVKSSSRKKEIATARHLSIYLIRDMTSLSLTDIGDIFGGRDHSTVLSSINKVKKQLEGQDSSTEAQETRNAITDLKKMIREN